ncbi:MAG: BMC domain-containing protein [Peptostreptococcaceae bacterium]
MSQLAIGMIETVGLAAAIEAADVCVKSANVTLIGYELTKGNGMTVVKIEGNVGAVKAAIEAATVAANKVSSVFSTKVIPRPSDGIDLLMRNSDTIGFTKSVEEVVEDVEEETESKDGTQEEVKENEVENNEDIDQINIEDNGYEAFSKEEIDEEIDEVNDDNLETCKDYTCNLCKDPKCPRQKGDLKTTCIHYEDLNN